MEASRILRGSEDEEHSSSESGWTMYIGSSIHENGHCNFIGDYNSCKQEEGCHNNGDKSQNDDESDDSMASDASNYQKVPSSCEQNLGMYRCKHGTLESISTEKLHKQVIIMDQRRNNIGKEKLELMTISTAANHVKNGNKGEDNQPFEPGRIGVSQSSQSS